METELPLSKRRSLFLTSHFGVSQYSFGLVGWRGTYCSSSGGCRRRAVSTTVLGDILEIADAGDEVPLHPEDPLQSQCLEVEDPGLCLDHRLGSRSGGEARLRSPLRQARTLSRSHCIHPADQRWAFPSLRPHCGFRLRSECSLQSCRMLVWP